MSNILCHQQHGVKWRQCWDVFRQNYRICITVTAILKYDHRYKIVPCYVSLGKHIILMKQLNGEDNKVSFELLMMKIDQIFIQLCDLL